MYLLKYYIFFLFITINLSCLAQFDTEFWFAPPNLSGDRPADSSMFLVFSGIDQGANVVISQPALGTSSGLGVPSGGSIKQNVSSMRNFWESATPGVVQNTGV